ncbi:hypothetical protein ACFQ0M_47730 [Kitasatospora aburaviensis]
MVRTSAGPASVEQRLELAVARVEWCEGELARLRTAVADEANLRLRALESLGVEVDRTADRLDRDVRARTVEGLSGEAFGLWLAGAGTVLQIWGTWIGD